MTGRLNWVPVSLISLAGTLDYPSSACSCPQVSLDSRHILVAKAALRLQESFRAAVVFT